MKRRDFLKTTMIMAAVSTVVGKAAGLFNSAHAASPKEKTLGYAAKASAAQVKAGKQCSSCHWFKADAKDKSKGECTLVAMQNAVKSKPVEVAAEGSCSMWKKKA